ncbi:MAG: hypothetical protein H8E27_01080 [Verrucomicrobia subdivision 3 bacterium]|nr:hypothetical protein [Limisphaerales bacterium]
MKKLITPLLSAAIIFGGLFISTSAHADDEKSAAEKPAKKKREFLPFRGQIKAVDVEENTISLNAAKGKPDRVFGLAKDAKLTLDGKKAKLAEIKAGMYVGGSYKRISETKTEARTVNVHTKKPERKKKPKKSEDKK